MDVTGITALATDMAQTRTAQAVQLAVLKTAMNLEAQGALQLLQATVQAASNPPHLGNQVDTFA
jgi:hypothetical protein